MNKIVHLARLCSLTYRHIAERFFQAWFCDKELMVKRMYYDKKVLLIGGGGTLGTYTAKELMKLGCFVDIICPEEKVSDDERLCFYREYATMEFLTELLGKKHYDGIVNFIHYLEVESYKPFHKLLTDHTEHLIFLSSYRVYADLENPITENAPMLLDVTADNAFLKKETYALSKAKAEKFLRDESDTKNWTIVRPVISFSDKRLDIVVRSGREVIQLAKQGEAMVLPEKAKNLTAGLDWAGNSGKLIANLLFKEDALGEAYTVSSAQNLTWGEVADIYTELIGAKFDWVSTEDYIRYDTRMQNEPWILIYDRLFDRRVDNSKILKVTGLKKEDFISIKEGIKIELDKIKREEN